MARLYKVGRELWGAEVGTNSVAFSSKDLVAIKSGFLDKATTGDKIEGVCKETITMDSDNQTVAKTKVNFLKVDDYTEIEADIVWGTITQANVWSTFDIDANQDVDVTLGTPSQLRLIRVINSTKWVFQRAK